MFVFVPDIKVVHESEDLKLIKVPLEKEELTFKYPTKYALISLMD